VLKGSAEVSPKIESEPPLIVSPSEVVTTTRSLLAGPKFQGSEEPLEMLRLPTVSVPIPVVPGESEAPKSIVAEPETRPVPPRAPPLITDTSPAPVAEPVALVASSVPPLMVVLPL